MEKASLPPPFPYEVTKPSAEYLNAVRTHRQIITSAFTRRSRRVVDANRRGIITSHGRKSRGFIPLIGTTRIGIRDPRIYIRGYFDSRKRVQHVLILRRIDVKVTWGCRESLLDWAKRESFSRWPEHVQRRYFYYSIKDIRWMVNYRSRASKRFKLLILIIPK